tara:strand:+ start:1136 stop:1888 length:753 start_codon:yes stop_codon:yes gene_type:complete
MQIDRKQFIEELLLRKAIRKAIRVVNERKGSYTQEEKQFKKLIRGVIKEQALGRDSTGVVALDHTLKSFVENLEKEYISLKTDKAQRLSFREHTLKFIENLFQELDGIIDAGGTIEEAINIDVEDDTPDEEKFIEVRPERIAKAEKETEREEIAASEDAGLEAVEGMDPTGHSYAKDFFKGQIKTPITNAYKKLVGSVEDRSVYKDWMMINLKIYFENFEEENFGVPQTEIPEAPPGSEVGGGEAPPVPI